MTLPIASIVVGHRHRKDQGDIAALAADIAEIGLLHPIVVTPSMRLIAGERQLLACKFLGWTQIPATIVDLTKITRGELSENTMRKQFTPSEEVAIYRTLYPAEKAAATFRKLSGRSASNGGDVRDKVAAYVGKSGRTIQKQVEVVEAAEAEPERFGPLLAHMDRTGKVNGPHKRLLVARKGEAIRKEPPPLPGKGPYRVIVADPPWPYELHDEDPSLRAACPYPTMTVDGIKALDVAGIAGPDSILWLWTTNFHMAHAFAVAAAWGFQPITILTWAKDRMGCGLWLRGQTEHCLLCTRGKPVITQTNHTTLLTAKVRQHSRKPEEFYRLVEALCPGSKAELFQRYPREGWHGHGDEVTK